MMHLVSCVRDQNLKLTLSFGIGLHHAGLHEKDREIAEELFVNQKIQVNHEFCSSVISSIPPSIGQ